jgi:hypothetical protein
MVCARCGAGYAGQWQRCLRCGRETVPVRSEVDYADGLVGASRPMVVVAVIAVAMAGTALLGPTAAASSRSPDGTSTVARPPVGVQSTEAQPFTGTQDSADSSPTADPDAAASAVNDLFTAMEASRGDLATALGDVTSCTSVIDAAATIQQVASDRATQLRQAENLSVDALTDGSDLQSALVSALTYSQQADQSYAVWASAVAAGDCSDAAPTTPDRQAGDTASQSATAYKTTAVNDWNQIAGGYGYQTVDAGLI